MHSNFRVTSTSSSKVQVQVHLKFKLPLAVPMARVPASNYPVKYLDLIDLLSNDYNGHGGRRAANNCKVAG